MVSRSAAITAYRLGLHFLVIKPPRGYGRSRKNLQNRVSLERCPPKKQISPPAQCKGRSSRWGTSASAQLRDGTVQLGRTSVALPDSSPGKPSHVRAHVASVGSQPPSQGVLKAVPPVLELNYLQGDHVH